MRKQQYSTASGGDAGTGCVGEAKTPRKDSAAGAAGNTTKDAWSSVAAGIFRLAVRSLWSAALQDVWHKLG